MYRVDIAADLNDEDDTGYVWTFLDEARDPAQIKPGAIIVAGDEATAAVCEVVDLAPAADGTIVHLKLLPLEVLDGLQGGVVGGGDGAGYGVFGGLLDGGGVEEEVVVGGVDVGDD